MTAMPKFDFGNASSERLNDATFFLQQLVDHFLYAKADIAKASCVDHHQYLLEFGSMIDHPLNWNLHREGTFGREVVYVRNANRQMQPVSLSTHRRLIRLTREKHGVNEWVITTLEGNDFDGRKIGITGLVGVYMEKHHEAEIEWRRTRPDSTLPGKVGQILHSLQHLAEEMGVKPSDLSWTEAVELLHQLQRKYGMWEVMKDNAIHFNANNASVTYVGGEETPA